MTSPQKKAPTFTIARRVVQFATLLLFAVPLLVVGSGIFGTTSGKEELDFTAATLPFFGSLSSSTVAGVTVLDPFAVLQAAAASKTFDLKWLVGVLPVLVVYGLVRGRAFCGWVCPVNLVLEGVDWLRVKLGLSVVDHAVSRHAKLAVAVVILALSALTGMLVFELFNPISAINKLILFGSVTGLVTLGAIVVAELFWARRVWCRALCPLGGFYEALGQVGVLSVKMDHGACTHCGLCSKACLADPEILQPALDGSKQRVAAGDCMLCGKCVEVCPTAALSIGPASPFPK
ncbi:MAG: 4Fe-4S binding protein [Eggerthellaceae bacterium]|nr:4Fe-4S binding protein [Eggerthellaceae bacterium]